MSNRVDLETVIDSHIAAWTPPCKLFRDNVPARNKDLDEWMRLTVGDGLSFLRETAGLQDVTGSTAQHGFILSFDIFTELNSGTARAAEIGQHVSDYWAFHTFGNIHFDAATFQRVGEEDRIYHSAVIIDAVRYETLNKR